MTKHKTIQYGPRMQSSLSFVCDKTTMLPTRPAQGQKQAVRHSGEQQSAPHQERGSSLQVGFVKPTAQGESFHFRTSSETSASRWPDINSSVCSCCTSECVAAWLVGADVAAWDVPAHRSEDVGWSCDSEDMTLLLFALSSLGLVSSGMLSQ